MSFLIYKFKDKKVSGLFKKKLGENYFLLLFLIRKSCTSCEQVHPTTKMGWKLDIWGLGLVWIWLNCPSVRRLLGFCPCLVLHELEFGGVSIRKNQTKPHHTIISFCPSSTTKSIDLVLYSSVPFNPFSFHFHANSLQQSFSFWAFQMEFKKAFNFYLSCKNGKEKCKIKNKWKSVILFKKKKSFM